VRTPTFRELLKFVQVEGWTDKDAASGRSTGNHLRFVFTTPMGERLTTRISHGSGQIRDADLFRHILRDQLKVTEDQFWSAVDKGIVPVRERPGTVPDESALDAKLARNLIAKVGLQPSALIGMTQQEALEAWTEWLAQRAETEL
jgi:hypothetical protein